MLRWLLSLFTRGRDLPPGLDATQYRVTVDEDKVTCKEPDGSISHITWQALRRVTITTTNLGPAVCDLFWMLEGDSLCLIPQGAPGEEALLPRLQQLPGFNNKAVIEASCSTELMEFVCWERNVTKVEEGR